MSKQLKSSNKGSQQQNFSLKCVKSLQKCVKDLKRAIRQLQFESQRIQKHQIQQLLNNSNNLLTALTSCNLYRIHFQEEMYYLTQLQKIEKGVGEILEFVSKIINRKFFTSLGNNKQSEDLFTQLESTFDQFVGPLLHIFNSFNVNWLLFQCDPQKLFLLDEFNEEVIIQKLGIGNNEQNDENSTPKLEASLSIQESSNSQDSVNQQRQKSFSKESDQFGSNQNVYSINIVSTNKTLNKILVLKNNQQKYEGVNGKKQFLNEILNEYKQIVPENTCLSELAILIDFIADQNPHNYQKVFLEYYVQLFDYSTSEKISNILHKTHSFDKLNKYFRLIFYNTDIMRLSTSEIVHYLHCSSSFQLKDLHLSLFRSGFNPLPVPVTNSPIYHHTRGQNKMNQKFQFQSNSTNSLRKQKEDDNQESNFNSQFTSSNFKIGQTITLCPHQPNFFSLTPIFDGKDQYHSKQNEEIFCQYVKSQKGQQQFQQNQSEKYVQKRSQTISQRHSEIYTSQLTTDVLNFQKQIHLKHQNTLASESINDISEDLYDDNEKEEENEDKKVDETFLFKKKELLFGRKAKNSILKPDFYFEDNEISISRQQFKITFEDQSNEYNVQCMSHSSLTQLVIDEVGFELTTGSVFIIQDQIAFQVIALKQFPEQSQSNQGTSILSNNKIITNKNAANQSNTNFNGNLEKDHNQKKQHYKSRNKSGRLSYKSSQLFEEYDTSQTSNEQQRGQDGEANNFESESANSNSDTDDLDHQATHLSNSMSENENSSINSSIASISSLSCIMGNTSSMQHQFDKRASLNNKKNSFINSIRQQNSRQGSLITIQANQLSPNNDINSVDSTPQNVQQINKSELSPFQQSYQHNTEKDNQIKPDSILENYSLKQNNSNGNNTLISENPQINLIKSESDSEEFTHDFKKSSITNSEKQQNLGIIQQSTLMNGMSLSTSRLMMQSNLNQMNQSSVYSIAGQSLYELEDDPLSSTDAILHIRVLWSSIETEKEDYLFQYNNSTDRDSIIINFGSDKDNQIRIQDENKAIRSHAHCTIAYQDNAWNIMSSHNEPAHYSGLALKKIEEIENGLVSKKILIENGFKVLVQGYIFNCSM